MDDLRCWLAFVFAAPLIFHEAVFSAGLNQLLSGFKAFLMSQAARSVWCERMSTYLTFGAN